MNKQAEFEDGCEVEDVPASPLMAVERKSRFGSVPGLDDEELADPCELERAVVLEQWGPVLSLPVRKRQSRIQPNIDESFGVDYGAFATVDFERSVPEFDKARYKADKLQEELRDAIIVLSIVSERLPGAKFKVLKYLRMGVIDNDHIESEDMRQLAMMESRARRLQAEITELRKASWKRRQARVVEVLR